MCVCVWGRSLTYRRPVFRASVNAALNAKYLLASHARVAFEDMSHVLVMLSIVHIAAAIKHKTGQWVKCACQHCARVMIAV